MQIHRLKEAWEGYKKILPRDASNTQIVETRRAFYAGAQTLLAIMALMLDPGEEATEADLKKMDDIAAELDEFAADVKRGRA